MAEEEDKNASRKQINMNCAAIEYSNIEMIKNVYLARLL